MNDLRLLYHVDKDRKIINLQYKQITSIDALLPTLAKFENLECLSLMGNRLKSLPNLEVLENLSELDISNNLFEGVKELIAPLSHLKNLRHLIYTFKSKEEEEELLLKLPNLQRLNKKPLSNKVFIKKQTKKSKLKLQEKDLEEIGVIYDQIRDLYRSSKYMVDKQLMMDFDKSIDIIMTDLSIQLKDSKNQTQIDTSIITCRYGLIDMCFTKIITYFYHIDKNVAIVLQKIHDYIAESFKSIGDIMKAQQGKVNVEVSKLKVKKEQLYKDQIKRLKAKDQEALRQTEYLQEKNDELVRMLTEYSKGVGENLYGGGGHYAKSILRQLNSNPKVAPLSEHKNLNNSQYRERSNSRSQKRSHSRRRHYSPSGYRNHSPYALQFSKVGSEIKGEKQTEFEYRKMSKNLTLHQLHEIINEIYQSKAKQDKICMESGLAMETMEEYMYTYLNQKYGLKSLTIEWAMGIVGGIKKHGMKEPQIAIFGKILRNQIEENYHETLEKSKLQIRQQFKRFKGSLNEPISINEAEEILLNCRFDRQKISLIIPRVKNDMSSEGKVQIESLQSGVLDYVVRQHEQQIEQFVKLFKQVDTKGEGWINREQVLKLIEKTGKEVDQELLFEHIDPFINEKMTFSWLYQALAKDETYRQLFEKV